MQARGELVPMSADEDAIEFSWVRQTARRVGTVVHEALERFGRGVLAASSELPALRARLESRLQALGVDGEAARAGAERALTRVARHARGRPRPLAVRSRASRCALGAGAHRRARGPDRQRGDRPHLRRRAEGMRWVVDFKTSPHEGGDLQAFLDAEAMRYEAQLQRYAHLARELGPEPVRAGLYFPLLAAWREVDVAVRLVRTFEGERRCGPRHPAWRRA